MAFVNLLQAVYPVGSIYISATNTSPATIIGGTWFQITARFLYANTNPTTTGGTNSHSHVLSNNGGAMIDTIPGVSNNKWINIGTTSSNRSFSPRYKHAFETTTYNSSNESAWHTVALEGNTDSITTMPSYYTVCAWVRTA